MSKDEQVAQAVKKHLVPSSEVTDLPGCSVTHDIYKWTKDHERHKMRRSQSAQVAHETPSDPTLANLKDPGGFRRYYVVNQQNKRLPYWITNSFVDFLAIYGRFGGEDLNDEDDPERLPLVRQEPNKGNASPTKAVFLLLKSFIGTGVMFLPKA